MRILEAITPARVPYRMGRRAGAVPSIGRSLAPKPTSPVAPVMPSADTEHGKVFRLVAEGKVKEAARSAARLINAGQAGGFFIYGTGGEHRKAADWFSDQIALGKRGIHASVHSVSPYAAQVMLTNNEGNRRVSAPNLENLMRDILAGNWDVNGETIKVSSEGLINDAQHRLFAVVLTGAVVKFLIAFGLQRETKRTVDIGAKRTAAARATMRGEPNAVVAAAAAALAFELYNGRSGTSVEVDDYLSDFTDPIHRAISATGGSNINRIGKAAPVVASMHLMSLGADPEDLKSFFHLIRTGLTTKNTNPARAIYNELNPTIQKARPLKLSGTQWVATLCEHFKLFIGNKRQTSVLVNAELPENL